MVQLNTPLQTIVQKTARKLKQGHQNFAIVLELDEISMEQRLWSDRFRHLTGPTHQKLLQKDAQPIT